MKSMALVVPGLTLALCMTLASTATAAPGDRSPDGLWVEVDRTALGTVRYPLPTAFRAYRLNFDALRAILLSAPREVPGRGTSPVVVTLPLPDGTFAPVGVENAPVLSRELALTYPDIHTFVFHGTDNSGISGRMTLDPSSFQALLRPPSDLARVTPLTTSEGTFYLSFLNRDRTDGADDFRHFHEHPEEPEPPAIAAVKTATASFTQGSSILGLQSGDQLREFRLAVASTGEYYQARAGANGVNDVVNAIVAEVNNANVVFEAEVSVRFVINWLILYIDPANDPYSTLDSNITVCNTRDENPAAIDAVINNSDYDIGFVFSQGGGNGCAWYVVCLPDKARGAGLFNTSLAIGASTGLLVHEMGHQLGAHHTFSTITGSCGNPGEFNQAHSMEPGSGSTVMSYLGGCSPNDVDVSVVGTGMYYHTHTFDEIVTNITVGSGACASTVATANQPPVVDAGPDYTIPRGTPFTLTGQATDADGDALSYTWEQIDAAANARPINTDPGDGPLFRSFPPTASGNSRTFPNLADLLSNTVRNGEWLPTTDRTITMRLTARDDRTGGGGVANDDMVLTAAGAPFVVTSPNGGESFGAGCPLPVTWTVGGGSVAANVALGFSKSGGTSFDPLVASTPNDGAAEAVVPCGATNQARVKASGVGNVFFDVSNNNFSVVQTPPAVAVAANGGSVDDACQFVVTFNASVVDDCGVSANDVGVEAIKGGNNFDLGPVQFNAQQTNAQTVSVTGSVLVSNVSASPAILSIEVTGADACGASASDSTQVQIVDDTPPSIDVSLSPDLLWPPNHTLRDVHATVTMTDNCPGAGFVLTSVTSSEPDNGLGDGDTVGDIQNASIGTADVDLSLRAERQGPGSGRIYTATYTATDASDNQAQSSAVVVVPHSKKK